MLFSASAGIEATAGWSTAGRGQAGADSVPEVPPGRVLGWGSGLEEAMGAAVGAGVVEAIGAVEVVGAVEAVGEEEAEGTADGAGGGSSPFLAKGSSWTAR